MHDFPGHIHPLVHDGGQGVSLNKRYIRYSKVACIHNYPLQFACHNLIDHVMLLRFSSTKADKHLADFDVETRLDGDQCTNRIPAMDDPRASSGPVHNTRVRHVGREFVLEIL